MTSNRPIADDSGAALRGFGPAGLLAMLVILAGSALPNALLGGVLVLVWANWSGTPWRELGYARPRSWLRVMALGIPLGIGFKLFMKAIVMPLLGADPVNPAYHYLAGNQAALPGFILTLIAVAGFGEETVYRGYLFERLGKLLGSGAAARTAIIGLTSALFAAAHYPGQGLAGAEQAVMTGLVFGALYTVTGSLWTGMVVHVVFDFTALAMIYWNVESSVAHWVFR
jgi:hypothetical protein